MADALVRLLNLYGMLLRAHEDDPLTHREVVHLTAPVYPDYRGESGRRAFRRDRQHLQAAGVPIRQTYQTDIAGAPGWWIPGDEWFLPGLALTAEQRHALARAARTVDFGDVLWAPLAATKLTGRATDTSTDTSRTGTDGAPTDGAGRGTRTVAVFVAPPALPALQEARSRRAVAEFSYAGRQRRIDTWGLAHARGHWYVVGREHPTGQGGPNGGTGERLAVGSPEAGGPADGAHRSKVYRVDRIEGSVVLGAEPGAYEVPGDDEVRARVPADLWSWGGSSFPVRVAVDAEVAGIVAADVGEGLTTSPTGDGRMTLCFGCTRRDVFLSWVLGLGHRAEVLEPTDLRVEVVRRLRSVLAETSAP